MDETEFRILDTLSRDPGRELSISDLTREVRRLHGTAYYPNSFRALRGLQGGGVVALRKIGNASMASLDFRSEGTIDALSEMEIRKRRALLAGSGDLRRFFDAFSVAPAIGPTSLVDAERNLKLGRVELLGLIPEWALRPGPNGGLRADLRALGDRLGLRIDALWLDEAGFRSLLASRGRNPLREMLARQAALLAPDMLWIWVRNAWAHGTPIRFDAEETNPARIPEPELLHNLAALGYAETGSRPGDGRDIGLEYVVTALLLRGDARRVRAIPALLAANPVRYPVLLFLVRKYGLEGRLLGHLRVAAERGRGRDLEDALRSLERAGVEEGSANPPGIGRNGRTHRAVGRA